MVIEIKIKEGSQRLLSDKEILALQARFNIPDVSDFFVAEGDEDTVHNELVMRRVVGENEPNLTEEEVVNHSIVCSLLWLSRLDSGAGDNFKEQSKLPKNVIVLEDSLVADHLGHLRREETSLRNFRFHSDQLCADLFRKAVSDLSMNDADITNSLVREMGAESMRVPKLAEKVIIVPILRAGLAMMGPAREALPKSKIGLIGMARNEETLEPETYLSRLPEIEEDSVVILTDPMLATAGSMSEAIEEINKGEKKPKMIIIVCVVAAPEGIAAINKKYDNIKIVTAAVDSHLNESGFIVPGLGDYGDRYTGVA